jgi:hypothetical protein
MTTEKKQKNTPIIAATELPNDSDIFDETIIDGISYKVPKQHGQYIPIKARNSFPNVERPGYFRYWFKDEDYQAEIAPYVARGFRKVEDVPPVYAGYVHRGREVMHVLYEIPLEIHRKWQELEARDNYDKSMRNIVGVPSSAQRNTNFYATTEAQEDLVLGNKVIRRK